ncbi:hypothetical protein Rhal01_01778 [Rubritalea halochordaticola]|uniref:Lipoprotein n=1 Tax=Rubritalea halochordaticola TaxID=714537 RepID=A0ABP9UYS7_9BACT
MHRFLLFLFISILSTSCSTLRIGREIDYSPASSVRRIETLRIAESYRRHLWAPTEQNILHGQDSDGIRVDTPDSALSVDRAGRPGWWKPGKMNQGMPYQWGGFDTPESFDQKIKQGFAAGDVYTSDKRRHLYDAVSNYACGVDCSGFISRCWLLDRPYSTRELPKLCTPLTNYNDLKAGDILNKHNTHVLLFYKFIDKEKTRFLAYETGSPPTWKVLLHPIKVDYVKGLGYKPYRYKRIID